MQDRSGVTPAVALTPRRSGFRWVIAALFFLVYAVASADRANLGFALPFIRKDFAMSNTEAGALLSLFLWGYALAQIPSGLLISRFGVRGLFSGSMILTSVLTGLMGTAASPFLLKFYRFALGIVEGPLPVGITSTINNWFPAREKGTASGLFLSAVKFGPVIVPPTCAPIVALWGWREIFFIFAIPGLVLACVWYVLVPNHPSQSRFCSEAEQQYILTNAPAAGAVVEAPRRKFDLLDRLNRTKRLPLLTSTAGVFGSWNIWGCALGYAFQAGITNVLLAWLPTYLLTVKKFSVMGTGFVAAAPWVGAVVGNLIGGWFSDRVLGKRRKPNMMFSAVATAAMIYALIHAPADPTQYAVVLFVTGVMLSIGYSSYMVYPMGLADKKTFPVASSLVNTGGQIGGAAAPLIVGFLLDSSGWNAVFQMMVAGSLMSLVVVATIAEPEPE